MMKDEDRLTEDAIDIAKKAGTYLLENFKKDSSLYRKRGLSKEVTTKYDISSDEIIITEIEKRYPDHSILTEESGKKEKGSDHLWIIDSMDGSSNFAAGNPFFSVSIGIMKDEKLIVGVIYAPYLDELYVARRGKGATLNARKICVSDTPDLSGAYVVACEGGSKTNERMSKLFDAIYADVKDMRKLGSAALEAGFVASGRADAFTTLDISPWDVAAGILVVEEAGGKVTDFEGNAWRCNQSDIIMSNKHVHAALLERTKTI